MQHMISMVFQITRKKLLLWKRQPPVFHHFVCMRLHQLLQHPVRRITPNITVICRHVGNLMQNRLNVTDRRRLQAPVVRKPVIEPLNKGFPQITDPFFPDTTTSVSIWQQKRTSALRRNGGELTPAQASLAAASRTYRSQKNSPRALIPRGC